MTPLYTANIAFSKKNRIYGKYIDHDNFFTPCVLETFGAMHPHLEGIIRRASHTVNHKPPERATWTAPNFAAYYFQRLSCALQRMNAKAIVAVIEEATKYSQPSSHQRVFNTRHSDEQIIPADNNEDDNIDADDFHGSNPQDQTDGLESIQM